MGLKNLWKNTKKPGKHHLKGKDHAGADDSWVDELKKLNEAKSKSNNK